MQNKKLTLAIVIPVYNEENYIGACLDAIACQQVMPDEVIVVDNNSIDRTVKIAQKYTFVRVVKEKKQGVLHARNAGFNAVNSTIIGRIDSDTLLPPDWVKAVIKFYDDSAHADYALTGGCYFYNVRFPKLCGWAVGQIAFRFNRFLLGHYILYGSNMAFLSTQWHNVKDLVCIDQDVHEDLDLAIHLHRLGYLITYHESLRVKVAMRRVRSRRLELWANMMWWPQTLRRHGSKKWILGYVGAVILYVFSPMIPLLEKIAQVFGKPPIKD